MTKTRVAGIAAIVLVGAGAAFFVSTQKDDTSAVGTRVAPPDAAPIVAAAGAETLQVAETGTATFLIDAPLEKIKGRWTKFRGTLSLDPTDLTKSKGEVDIDLADLKTETFGDASKDSAQTEHAHNWFEIGADAQNREANRWARFTLSAVESATPAKLDDAPATNGTRTVKLVVKGDLWIHGVTSPKTAKMTAVFTGPSSAPTSVVLTTDEPLPVSLKEHDVKPRDVAGKFLAGSLEKVGDKITDTALVTLSVTASLGGAPAAMTAPVAAGGSANVMVAPAPGGSAMMMVGPGDAGAGKASAPAMAASGKPKPPSM